MAERIKEKPIERLEKKATRSKTLQYSKPIRSWYKLKIFSGNPKPKEISEGTRGITSTSFR